jgi:enamine deaminase RidA (YjgF/YER057c/UK114 family)
MGVGAAVPRQYSWPEGHWDWPIKVTHKHGVRSGNMIFVGGQVDLDDHGRVLHPGDLKTQIAATIRNLGAVLTDLGAGLHDIVKLQAFYVSDGTVNEGQFLDQIAAEFVGSPGLAINAVPLPYLGYPGLSVEIEAIAMIGGEGRPLPRTIVNPQSLVSLPAPLVHGVRCGQMILLSGQSPRDHAGRILHAGDIVAQSRLVMDHIGEILRSFGGGFHDAVKLNRWYTGQGSREDWEPAAIAIAAHFAEPGPAATGIPVPRHAHPEERIKIDLIAMLGEDGQHLPRRHSWPEQHWDWPIHLPYKHGLQCGDLIFVGGQVALDQKGSVVQPGQLAAQTRTCLEYIRRVLSTFGLDMDATVKVLALYSAIGKPEELHTNLSIRSAAFKEPGPATTGVPLPCLAYRDLMIEIEIIAMTT